MRKGSSGRHWCSRGPIPHGRDKTRKLAGAGFRRATRFRAEEVRPKWGRTEGGDCQEAVTASLALKESRARAEDGAQPLENVSECTNPFSTS